MAVDSFFTDPSKKKRKRSGRQSSLAPRGKNSNKKSKSQREAHNSSDDEELDEEEIASDIFSDDSDAEKSKKHELENEKEDLDSDEEFAGETAADKRRRLAKQYLDNLKQETENYDFDAKDLDDEIIASRLQKDVAEQQGHSDIQMFMSPQKIWYYPNGISQKLTRNQRDQNMSKVVQNTLNCLKNKCIMVTVTK
ncbi:unnamed protein product [[Candida] boidinii]|nr:unnamed protein product [[Candida] boidinii]